MNLNKNINLNANLNMNKYIGFYELKSINIPAVPWREFTGDTVLDGNLLWTVRVALENGNDLNLPRAVGVNADEAVSAGKMYMEEYGGKAMVVYYPYFIAEKSGVLGIKADRTVMEAVEGDLWNLVTHGRKNVTIIIRDTACTAFGENMGEIMEKAAGGGELPGTWTGSGEGIEIYGDRHFLGTGEIVELLRNGSIMRGRFRDELDEGGEILAEWSFAYKTDISRKPIGDRYLVFYELRGI